MVVEVVHWRSSRKGQVADRGMGQKKRTSSFWDGHSHRSLNSNALTGADLSDAIDKRDRVDCAERAEEPSMLDLWMRRVSPAMLDLISWDAHRGLYGCEVVHGNLVRLDGLGRHHGGREDETEGLRPG